MNRDGKLDLIISTQSGFDVLFGNGDVTFQQPVSYANKYPAPFLTVADINGDGYLDVLCANPQTGALITIFPGEAGGALGKPYNFAITNYIDIEVGDVNGDGIPDLVSDSVYVAYGLGHGQFSTPVYFPVGGETLSNATKVVLAHLRSPDVIDLITNDDFTHISVLLNNGKGKFLEGITTPLQTGLGCATELDFNNDGIPDLGFTENGTSFLVEYGTGKVAAPFATGPSTAIPQNASFSVGCPSNFGDINGDGIPDFIIPEVSRSGSTTILYPFFGQGNGIFQVGAAFVMSGNQSSINLVDVNGDGKADLITPNTNQIWYGNGSGAFGKPVTLVSGVTNSITDVVWADLNGDGKLDFVVQVEDGIETIVLLSQPAGGFLQTSMNDCSSTVCFDTFGVALGDLNGDGIPDLLLGSELSTMGVFINDGTGQFTFAEELTLGGLSTVAYPILVDLNGDGKLDIAVSGGSDIGVLTNEGNLTFSQGQYFGQTGTLYFGNWHGQAASAGKPDIMMPGSSSITMLYNETK